MSLGPRKIQPDEPAFSERLCATIKQYWRIRGVKAEAATERVVTQPRVDQKAFSVFVIRSRGIPVRGK